MLFQQLFLTGDVAAVALGQDVLAHGLDGLAGDNLPTDSGLDGHFKELARDIIFELFADLPSTLIGFVLVDNEGQSVHLVAVEEQVYFHQAALLVIGQLIVQRGITFGVCFQGIEEVIDDLVQGHLIVDLYQVGVQILHIHKLPPAILAEGHDVAYKLVGGDNGHIHKRLQRFGNAARVGVVMGVVHKDRGTIGLDDLVDNAGQGGD